MKAELQKFLKLFEDLEEAGAAATLTFSTRGSKTTAKLHLETFSSSPPPTSTALSSLPPSPGTPTGVDIATVLTAPPVSPTPPAPTPVEPVASPTDADAAESSDEEIIDARRLPHFDPRPPVDIPVPGSDTVDPDLTDP